MEGQPAGNLPKAEGLVKNQSERWRGYKEKLVQTLVATWREMRTEGKCVGRGQESAGSNLLITSVRGVV